MTDIILQAYQVLDEIRKDPMYDTIKTLDRHIGTLYAKEIDAFQKAKSDYESVMSSGGSYHPDFKDAVRKFSEAKAILYDKPEVKTYFETERTFQESLNQFLSDLSRAVSSHVKAPDAMGIVKKGGSCHVR